MWVLAIVARPYTWWRVALVAAMGVAFLFVLIVPALQRFFALKLVGLAIPWAFAMGALLSGKLDERWLIEIEVVAANSRVPILLTGPTGAGKTRLARRIYELKKERRQVSGAYVEVNCATLRGDQAMSALFGHVKGAFTGAQTDRPGLLRTADGGAIVVPPATGVQGHGPAP